MISWEHGAELLLQLVGRRALRDREQLARFRRLAGQYEPICRRLLDGAAASNSLAEGYDWAAWAASIRKSFAGGVPIGFLSNSVVRRTMVFAARRGIRHTAARVDVVRDTFGDEIARELLREDYIGLPTITSLRYRTSAHRAYHAADLAWYRRTTGRDLWDCRAIVEWGGGYGNMARIVVRMNPAVSYAIIDLPELLALQYVYLGSLLGESRLCIAGANDVRMEPGRITLIGSESALANAGRLRADAMISTWALTESPRAAQESIVENSFFGAERILFASTLDANNFVLPHIDSLRLQRLPVPRYGAIGGVDEYWVR